MAEDCCRWLEWCSGRFDRQSDRSCQGKPAELCTALSDSAWLLVVQIRFQSYTPTNKNPYRHTLHAFAEIFRTEGIRGLYKVRVLPGCLLCLLMLTLGDEQGAVPTTARAAVLTGENAFFRRRRPLRLL